MCTLSPVAFHGDTIFCIDYQNQPFTPMRPIVQNMGLDWASQSVKLNANKERWGVVMIATPSEGGEQKMLSMPVRKLPAWLNSINPKKVRPELRPKIELYQAESDDALWNYWMNGRAERTTKPSGSSEQVIPSDAPLTPDQQCTLKAMVKTLVEKGGHFAAIWSRFNNHFRLGSYKQLPQARMSEAVDYLMRLEVAPKALPASAPSASESPAELAELPDTRRLFKDIQAAADRLAPCGNWTHLAVRLELGNISTTQAAHAVDLHVNAAWYALGLARTSLLAALAASKIGR